MRAKIVSNTTIDVSVLPKTARRELYDFYSFLIKKYSEKKYVNKGNKKAKFMKEVAGLRFHLPKDYLFNRDFANER